MAKSTPIPAFYEPGAPPPSLPVLTFQTEFVPSPDDSPTILTQDVPLSANKRPPSRPPSRNECDNPLKKLRFTSPQSSESGESQEGPDDGKSISSDDEDDGLIPKPNGEARRPNSGGYNLELELGWDAKRFHSLKRWVHKQAQAHLDTKFRISCQNLKTVQDIQTRAVTEFPELENYRACWPVKELIKTRLADTSKRWKKQQQGLAAEKLAEGAELLTSNVEKADSGKRRNGRSRRSG